LQPSAFNGLAAVLAYIEAKQMQDKQDQGSHQLLSLFANFYFNKFVKMFAILLYFWAQVNDIYRMKPIL